MARQLAQLRVRAIARDEQKFQYEDARARFWSALQNASSSKTEGTPSEYEAHLRNDFGPALTRKVVAHVNQGLGALNSNERPSSARRLPLKSSALERRIESLAAIFFQFKLSGYSSLDFSVEIAGIGHLARLLDNNFDLFMMLMAAYIPQSFYEAIPFGYEPDAISFDISADEDTREAFVERSARSQSMMGGVAGFARERALWMLINGTLLVPVLLALGICYVTYKGLADERAIIAANLQRVLAHEETFLKQSNDRLLALQNIENQVVARVLPSTTTAPPPAQPALPPKPTP